MNKYINKIIKLAEKAYRMDEVPVGAIVVHNGKIVGRGYNKKSTTKLVTSHAEIIAINKASKKINDWRLNDCELYVTLEPCNMCKEVIKQSRIKHVYYILESNFYNEKQIEIKYELIGDNDKQLVDNYCRKIKDFFKNKR